MGAALRRRRRAPSRLRPGLPIALDAVVARAMRKSPGPALPVGRRPGARGAGRRPAARCRRSPSGWSRAARRRPAAPRPSRGSRPRPRRSPRSAPRVTAPPAAALGGRVARGRRASPPARRSPRAPSTTRRPTAQPRGGGARPRRSSASRGRDRHDVGQRPSAIAYAAGDLWVVSSADRTLTRIDAATGRKRAQQTDRRATGVVSMVTDGEHALGRGAPAPGGHRRRRPDGPRRPPDPPRRGSRCGSRATQTGALGPGRRRRRRHGSSATTGAGAPARQHPGSSTASRR